jgi:hypothetical protein
MQWDGNTVATGYITFCSIVFAPLLHLHSVPKVISPDEKLLLECGVVGDTCQRERYMNYKHFTLLSILKTKTSLATSFILQVVVLVLTCL